MSVVGCFLSIFVNYIKMPFNSCASLSFYLVSPNKIWLVFWSSINGWISSQCKVLLCFVQLGCKWLNQCDLQKISDNCSTALTAYVKHFLFIRTLHENKFLNLLVTVYIRGKETDNKILLEYGKETLCTELCLGCGVLTV